MSSVSKEHRVTKSASDLELSEVSGYVTCVHNNWWWLACVLETDAENVEVKLTLLHPHGPGRSYKYPSVPDILTPSLTDILAVVKPRITTNHAFTLTQRESKTASDKLSHMA